MSNVSLSKTDEVFVNGKVRVVHHYHNLFKKLGIIAYSLLYRVRNNQQQNFYSAISGSLDLGHAHFFSVSYTGKIGKIAFFRMIAPFLCFETM